PLAGKEEQGVVTSIPNSPVVIALAGIRGLTEVGTRPLHHCVRCSGSPWAKRSLHRKLPPPHRDHRRCRPGKGRIRQATDLVMLLIAAKLKRRREQSRTSGMPRR